MEFEGIFTILHNRYLTMKITDTNTGNIINVDLEPELLDRISNINITNKGHINISFDQHKPEINTSIFKKVINAIKFIKKWKWILTPIIPTIPIIFRDQLHQSLKGIVISTSIVFSILIICIKIIIWKR